jgi:hypothetical protein
MLLLSGAFLTFAGIFLFFGLGMAVFAAVILTALWGACIENPAQPSDLGGPTPDREKTYQRLGTAVLVFAAMLALTPLLRTDSVQEQIAILRARNPTECDWTAAPFGDKHCHFESTVSQVSDDKGKHTVVEWHRADD